jgi:hypothetical protein
MLHQEILKRPETVVIEIVLPVALKGWYLDESSLLYVNCVHTQATYKTGFRKGIIDERTKESRQLVALSERQKASFRLSVAAVGINRVIKRDSSGTQTFLDSFESIDVALRDAWTSTYRRG